MSCVIWSRIYDDIQCYLWCYSIFTMWWTDITNVNMSVRTKPFISCNLYGKQLLWYCALPTAALYLHKLQYSMYNKANRKRGCALLLNIAGIFPDMTSKRSLAGDVMTWIEKSAKHNKMRENVDLMFLHDF